MGDDGLEPLLDAARGWGTYVWFVLVAIWGGAANYISRVNTMKMRFSVMEFTGESVVSGFAGVITLFACEASNMDTFWMGAMTGLAGHAGPRAIYMLQNAIFKFPTTKVPVDAPPPKPPTE